MASKDHSSSENCPKGPLIFGKCASKSLSSSENRLQRITRLQENCPNGSLIFRKTAQKITPFHNICFKEWLNLLNTFSSVAKKCPSSEYSVVHLYQRGRTPAPCLTLEVKGKGVLRGGGGG